LVIDEAAHRLFELALDLARIQAARFRELERDAANEIEGIALAPGGGGKEALSAACLRCEQTLVDQQTGEPETVLAHRLLQLALAPHRSDE
jgi:hypothetical protein